MKKSLLVVALVMVSMLSSFAVKAQSNAIKINPLSLALATVNLQYERALSGSKSFQLGVLYTGVKLGDVKYSGFSITPEYRMYLTKKDEELRGFYIAPYLRYSNNSLSAEEDMSSTKAEATLSSIGGGLVLGNQWCFGDRVTLDLFIGPSYSSSSIKYKGTASEDDFSINGAFSGLGVRTGITLGIAF